MIDDRWLIARQRSPGEKINIPKYNAAEKGCRNHAATARLPS
jgi:hypothetical protein